MDVKPSIMAVKKWLFNTDKDASGLPDEVYAGITNLMRFAATKSISEKSKNRLFDKVLLESSNSIDFASYTSICEEMLENNIPESVILDTLSKTYSLSQYEIDEVLRTL